MAGYAIDPERSTATAVRRPQLDDAGAMTGTVRGEVELDGDDPTVAPTGQIEITLADPGARPVIIDVADTAWDLLHDERGEPVLYGRATRPTGAVGLAGPPLLNPVVQLSWRLVLVPR